MRVQIVTRHCDVPAAILTRAQEQLPRLSRFDQRLSAGEVVFEEERYLKRAEGVLTLDGGEPVVARGEGLEFRGALDQMLERLSRILRRRRTQALDHHGPKLSDVVESGI